MNCVKWFEVLNGWHENRADYENAQMDRSNDKRRLDK